MLNALKTDGKFNPYTIVLPVAAAFAAWQFGRIVVGWTKVGYEIIQEKKNENK